MGFWSLFLVASAPIVQVLLIGSLGAFLASGYSNILTSHARRDINKVLFTVFAPSLMFSSLVKAVTLQEIISWWFMPINIGITYLVGGILGWIAVKILRPPRKLESVVIAMCSSGNMGNLLLIIIPSVCEENGNPFGDHSLCHLRGLSYVSFSMALGGIYIWTLTYPLMKNSAKWYNASQSAVDVVLPISDNDSDASVGAVLFNDNNKEVFADRELSQSINPAQVTDANSIALPLLSSSRNLLSSEASLSHFCRMKRMLQQLAKELLAPPTVGAMLGLIAGIISCLKYLFVGENAPLAVIYDSLKILGNGTVPCITIILGGNLTQGLRKSQVKPMVILAIIFVRYAILPAIGIAVVRAAYEVGFLPHDPLYRYVLLIQFAVPPAMNIGTIAQLLEIGQEECSVIFFWVYMVAAIVLTIWSTIFMWILS